MIFYNSSLLGYNYLSQKIEEYNGGSPQAAKKPANIPYSRSKNIF